MHQMRVGIIGGAGPQASALLHQKIIDLCYQHQLREMPELIFLSYPFTHGMSLIESAQNRHLLEFELQSCVDVLARCEVSLACIACNTLHLLLPTLQKHDIEFLHMPALVLEKIKEEGCSRIAVLSTPTTAATGLYQDVDLEIKALESEEQQLIDHVIHEVIQGNIRSSEAFLLQGLLTSIFQRDAPSGFVLGCTELPVLHHRYPMKVEGALLFDSLHILAESILQKILETSK